MAQRPRSLALRVMAAAVALAAGLLGTAHAQTVRLACILGSHALLMVNGGTPRSMATGEPYKSLKLVSVAGDQPFIDIGSQRITVRQGESPYFLLDNNFLPQFQRTPAIDQMVLERRY